MRAVRLEEPGRVVDARESQPVDTTGALTVQDG